MTEGICIAQGNEDFVRRAKDEGKAVGIDDLEIEFGEFDPNITWLDGVMDIIDEICIGEDCAEPASEPTR